MASSCVRRRLDVAVAPLVEELKGGLDAPICLTWELTYGCNLACVHCLSSSGRRDPRELSTASAIPVIYVFRDPQVCYVNIGRRAPSIRSVFSAPTAPAADRAAGRTLPHHGSQLNTQQT